MVPKSPLPFPQTRPTGPYPKPDESIPHHPFYLKIYSISDTELD
jgi:hypothetical protein